jgi:hypothetical protein
MFLAWGFKGCSRYVGVMDGQVDFDDLPVERPRSRRDRQAACGVRSRRSAQIERHAHVCVTGAPQLDRTRVVAGGRLEHDLGYLVCDIGDGT